MDHLYETTAPKWADFMALTPTVRDGDDSFFEVSHDYLKTPGYDAEDVQILVEKGTAMLNSSEMSTDNDDEKTIHESTFTHKLEDISLSPINVKMVERQMNDDGTVLHELNTNEINSLNSAMKGLDLTGSVSKKQNVSIDLGVNTPKKRKLRVPQSLLPTLGKLNESKKTNEKENKANAGLLVEKFNNSIDLGIETPAKRKIRLSKSLSGAKETPRTPRDKSRVLIKGITATEVISEINNDENSQENQASVDLNKSQSPKLVLMNVQEINKESEDMFVVHHCRTEVRQNNLKTQKKVACKPKDLPPPRPKAFRSLAEQVSAFQNRTPERFRASKNPAIQNIKRGPTIPKSPALQSKTRARKPAVLSQAEREELELQEMKKHQIHANPVPKQVLNPLKPLKAIPKKPLTVSKPFKLTETKKYTSAAMAPVIDPKKPAPKPADSKKKLRRSMSNPVLATKKSAPIKPKASTSKAAALEKHPVRSHSTSDSIKNTPLLKVPSKTKLELSKHFTPVKFRNELAIVSNTSTKNKSQIVSHFGIPLQNGKEKNAEKDCKKMLLPVSKSDIVTRSTEFLEKKKKKQEEEMRKELEELKKAKNFHANPVPVFARPKAALTFGLKSKVGGSTRSLKNEDNAAIFHRSQSDGSIINPKAKGDKKAAIEEKNEPVRKPSKSTMPPIRNPLKILPVKLHSDKRAKERKEYDEMHKQKLEVFEQRKKLEKENRLKQEQVTIIEQRKKAEIKARPMPVFKPPVIAKSTKPLTKAKSPAWAKH